MTVHIRSRTKNSSTQMHFPSTSNGNVARGQLMIPDAGLLDITYLMEAWDSDLVSILVRVVGLSIFFLDCVFFSTWTNVSRLLQSRVYGAGSQF